MDPVTLIVTALAAGAASGLGDTVSQAVKDAYGALKSLVRDRLGGHAVGEMALEQHEQAPDTWREPLTSQLRAAGIAPGDDVVALAQRLIELITVENPSALGKYTVDASSATAVQIGDHATQHNTFGSRPGPA